MQRIVFVDTETGGLDPTRHPLIQLAAVAVEGNLGSGDALREVGALEVKVEFDEAKADKDALELNHYSATVWRRDALPRQQAVSTIAAFLRAHATVPMEARSGGKYKVAQFAGHNVQFDMSFIKALFGTSFVPASYRVMDTCSLALWVYHGREDAPRSYKLGDLCRHLGVPLSGAHDAMEDIRATVAVTARLLALLRLNVGGKL